MPDSKSGIRLLFYYKNYILRSKMYIEPKQFLFQLVLNVRDASLPYEYNRYRASLGGLNGRLR